MHQCCMCAYVHMHKCVYGYMVLVGGVSMAAWVMAIVTPVVAMAEWVVYTIIYHFGTSDQRAHLSV